MKTPSQTSFGARIDRAEKFHQRMLTFVGFEPGDESLTQEGYRALIDRIKLEHAAHQTTKTELMEEAHKRTRLFHNNPDAIHKIATKVKAYTRGRFGRDSHEFKSIERLVTKMRGQKPVTLRTGSGEQTISQTETAYGAQLVSFEDLIGTVTGFGKAYAPANDAISLPTLQLASGNANAANNSVSAKFALHKPTIAKRQDAFSELEERSTRIKDMARAQYGNESPEYKLIKGLNFTV